MRRRRLPRAVRHAPRHCPAYRERTCTRNCPPGPLCREFVARGHEADALEARRACLECGHPTFHDTNCLAVE